MNAEQANDLEQRLEHWGSADTPTPDGAFVNRLDAQLRDLAQVGGSERRPFWQPALLTALAVLMVGAGAFVVTRDSGQEIALVMGVTSQTEIELPDGELLVATEGLSLPDGTRISVGLEGSAVVNDVVLDAGTEAIVEDGALQILEARPVVSTTSRPTTTVERTTTTVQRSTTTPSTVPASSTTVTAAPTSAVPTSDIRTTVPTTAPDRSTTAPVPVVSLSWEEVDGDRVLAWTYRGPDTLAGWEVIVSNGDRSQVVAVLRDPAVRSITIDALAVPATYTVVARTADGTTLAESNPIEIP